MNEAKASPAPRPNDLADLARIEVHEPLDRQLAPLGRRALASLSPRAGERLLDIGCGAGQTVLDLARAVGPTGAVVGVDISAPQLEVAMRRAEGINEISFVQADAQIHPFESASFDAAFSRFGVMFFADPTAAFANIRKALKPAGRLAFVCWRALEENELDMAPLRAAAAFLPHQPPPEPDAPGAFAFAKDERVRGLLADAGFVNIEIAPFDQKVGSGDLEAMLAVCLRVGSLGKIVRETPGLHDLVASSVRAALAAHDGPDGVTLNAATWIVTARAPG